MLYDININIVLTFRQFYRKFREQGIFDHNKYAMNRADLILIIII